MNPHHHIDEVDRGSQEPEERVAPGIGALFVKEQPVQQGHDRHHIVQQGVGPEQGALHLEAAVEHEVVDHPRDQNAQQQRTLGLLPEGRAAPEQLHGGAQKIHGTQDVAHQGKIIQHGKIRFSAEHTALQQNAQGTGGEGQQLPCCGKYSVSDLHGVSS